MARATRTVGQLRAIIRDLPDNTPVLCAFADHRYRQVEINPGTALYGKDYGWVEDHGEELTPEESEGKRVEVLIIR